MEYWLITYEFLNHFREKITGQIVINYSPIKWLIENIKYDYKILNDIELSVVEYNLLVNNPKMKQMKH